MRNLLPLSLVAMSLLLSSCGTVYYATMEKFGTHKRDILVDRVEDAKESQEEAKEEFKSALEEFMSVVKVEPGELESTYKRLNSAYLDSKSQAEDVSRRIDSVEKVAKALFAEWEKELEQYSSRNLKQASERTLQQTRSQYDKLIFAMRKAEDKMQPVLTALNDQVLFLKHNLNAQAINSLQKELGTVESDVAALIKDMERSIDEAEAFINSMQRD